MTRVDFYHMTQSGHDAALTMLLKKTLAVGKKALILCPKPAASILDNALWADEADSWIAHGVDDAAGSDVAPVWISTDPGVNQNDATFAFLLHGQEPKSWDGFERVFNLFDGRSEAQVTEARTQWKSWSEDKGLQLSYYAQNEDGTWQKKA